MSATTHINAAHVLFLAEPAIAADQADGSYRANLAADSRHYMWQGDQQLIPAGMDGEPENFAHALRTALVGVNTLRLSFNDFAFNPDGSLHEQYERFLAAAVSEGFRLVLVYTDGEMQNPASGQSADQLYATLDGPVHDRMMRGWDKMLDWLDAHRGVKAAVWGYELANEPAGYMDAVIVAARGTKDAVEARFVQLFALHMAEAAAVIDQRAPGKILVPGWGYSGRFDVLAEHDVGSRAAVQYLRAVVGEDLVWAAHLYPGWHTGPALTDPAALRAAYDQAFAALGGDDILLTETNLDGARINDFSVAPNEVTAFARAMDYFTERGIGLTWFSAAEAGASSLVTVDPGGAMRLLHQHSYAFALHGFSLGEDPAAHRGGSTVWATTFAARLRNEAYEHDAAALWDAPRRVGTGFGFGGNDTVIGNAGANNFLYGGLGDDLMRGAGYEDFLFGQSGKDTLEGGGSNDLLFGGTGNDLLRGGSGADTLEGGAGADRIDAGSGSDLIVGFRVAEGDRLYLGRGYDRWADVAARLSYAAVNGSAVDDVVIRHADGSRTTVLDARGSFSAGALDFPGRSTWGEGTGTHDRLSVGFQDWGGQVWTARARRVDGLGGNDTLTSGGASDTLAGSDGHDVLSAGKGADHLLGGAGNDRLAGGAGRNVIDGGTGHDRMGGGGNADRMTGGSGNDRMSGDGGNDRMSGGSGNDRIAGDAGNDRLSGGAGRDRLSGGTGRDRLDGDSGNDTLTGGPGSDTLMGGSGNDRLFSGRDRSDLRGEAGRDTLVADISASGHRLTGGADRDTFVFTGFGSRADTRSVIEDFNERLDRVKIGARTIDLDDLPRGMTGRNTADGFVLTFGTGDTILFDDFWL